MKAGHAALVEALTGRFDGHHGELARMLLDQRLDTGKSTQPHPPVGGTRLHRHPHPSSLTRTLPAVTSEGLMPPAWRRSVRIFRLSITPLPI